MDFLNGVGSLDIERVELVKTVFVGRRFGDFDVLFAVEAVKLDGRARNARFVLVADAVVVFIVVNVTADGAEFQFAEVVFFAVLVPLNVDRIGIIVRGEVSAERTDRVFAVRIGFRLLFFDRVLTINVEVFKNVGAVRRRLRFGDFDVIRAVPLVKLDGNVRDPGFVRVENAVVVAVFEDVPGDGAELQLAEVVIVAVFAVTDVNVREHVVRNDAAERADVIFAVRIIGGIENFAQFVSLFDELAEFAVLTVRTVENELITARRVDRLRLHQRLAGLQRRSRRSSRSAPSQNCCPARRRRLADRRS